MRVMLVFLVILLLSGPAVAHDHVFPYVPDQVVWVQVEDAQRMGRGRMEKLLQSFREAGLYARCMYVAENFSPYGQRQMLLARAGIRAAQASDSFSDRMRESGVRDSEIYYLNAVAAFLDLLPLGSEQMHSPLTENSCQSEYGKR